MKVSRLSCQEATGLLDWAVHMRRLPDARSALSLLEAGRLRDTELSTIATYTADFYQRAERSPPCCN